MAVTAPSAVPSEWYPKKVQPALLGTIGTSSATQVQPWTLESAASLLTPYIEHERRRPDLDVICGSMISETHLVKDSNDKKNVNMPYEVSRTPLPTAFLDGLETAKYGFLSQLDLFWVTTADSKTFFWDPKSGSVKEFELSGENERIVDVAVVEPCADVFSDEITHLLVVSTEKEMRLVAVDSKKTFFVTTFKIDLKNVGVPLVCGSVNCSGFGRILFAGSTAGTEIFEFRYRKKDTWYHSRVERISHGPLGGLLSTLFGSVTGLVEGLVASNNGSSSVRVLALELDSEVGLLYALTTNSLIYVYSVGVDGTGFSLNAKFGVEDVHSKLASSHRQPPKFTKFVGLSPISRSCSRFLRFVAVTDTGARVYFWQSERAPVEAAYAQPPDMSAKFVAAKVGAGRYTLGVASTADKDSRLGLALLALDTERAFYCAETSQPVCFSELACWIALESKPLVLITAEERGVNLMEDILVTEKHVYTLRRRTFSERIINAEIPLTAAAVYGPARLCWAALDAASRTDSTTKRLNAMQTLVRFGGLPTLVREGPRYLGPALIRLSPLVDGLACYMASLLAPIWSRKVLATHELKGQARRQFYSELAGAHERLRSLADLLVRNRMFSETLSERQRPTPLSTRSGTGVLPAVEPVLGPMGTDGLELTSAELAVGLDESDSNSNDNLALLAQAEHKALHALGELARSSYEGIAFLRIALDSDVSGQELLAYFSKPLLDEFVALTFGTFFTKAKESSITRELVNSLVNSVLNRGKTVEEVAQRIRNQCPLYCSENDVLVYKALEYLHRAKSKKKNKGVDTANLAKSVDLIRKAAASVHLETLTDIVKDLVELKYYIGVVRLCLAVAAEQDPANIAIGYLRQRHRGETNDAADAVEFDLASRGVHQDQAESAEINGEPAAKQRRLSLTSHGGASNANTTSTGNTNSNITSRISKSALKYFTKMRIYDIIFKELLNKHPELADEGNTDPAHEAMLASPDELWHFALYDWYLNNNRQQQLALLTTPFVAAYLQQGARKNFQIANLLWRWLQRRGDTLAAADVLLGLSRGPLVTSLAQRVECLSRAMGYCRAQSTNTQAGAQLSTMVRAYLGLARLQSEIYERLRQREGGPPSKLAELDKKIYTVSELFNDWAYPYALFDVALDILAFADCRDRAEIRRCWEGLLLETRADDELCGRVHHIHVAAIVSELHIKFRAAPLIFSVHELLWVLEEYVVDFMHGLKPGWVAETMLAAGVPSEKLVSEYETLLANGELYGAYAAHGRRSLEYLRTGA